MHRVPGQDRGSLAEVLGKTTDGTLERDTKRIMKTKYPVGLIQTGHEVGEAVRRGWAQGITPAERGSGRGKARERDA